MSFFLRHFVRDIRKAIGCLCCLVIVGPLLFTIGMFSALEAPSDTEREDNLNLMNQAITKWNPVEPIFEGAGFTLRSLQAPYYQTALSQDNGVDFNTAGLNNYKPLKYSTTSAILPNYLTWKEGQNFTLQFTSSKTGSFIVNAVVFDVYKDYISEDSCRTENGEWDTYGYCFKYYVLDSVCVKVSNATDSVGTDTWRPDGTYGGIGCEYNNGYPADSSRWVPVQYRKVPYNNGAVLSQQFDFSGTQFTVRHQEDPYVYAQYLTKGSMTFGLTPGEKMAMGVALMAIGGFFMVPMCIFIVLLVVCCRRKREEHHHHHYAEVGVYQSNPYNQPPPMNPYQY